MPEGKDGANQSRYDPDGINLPRTNLRVRPIALMSFIGGYVLAVILSLWQNNARRRWNGFGLDADPLDAISAWGASDPASYLTLAHSIYSTGTIPGELFWIINLWAPGQSWVYLAGLWATGGQFFIVFLVLLDATLWLLVFMRIRSVFNTIISDSILYCSFGLYLLFSDFRGHILGPLVLYSDGTAAAVLILLALEVQYYWTLKSTRTAVLSGMRIGVLISGAVYLRSQNRYLMHAIFILLLMSTIWLLVWTGRSLARHSARKRRFIVHQDKMISLRQTNATRVLISTALSAGVIVVSLAPYLSWKGSNVGDIGWDFGGKYTLTSGDALVFPQTWARDDQLAPWQREGGGGWACRINPTKCDAIHDLENSSAKPWNLYDSEPHSTSRFRQMSIEVALKNPFHFLYDRLSYLDEYLFSETALVTPVRSPSLSRILQFGVSIMTVVRLYYLGRNKSKVDITGVWFGLLCLTIVTVVPPMLINFEVRYLLALRTVINVFFFIGVSMSIKSSGVWIYTRIRRLRKI